MAVREDAEYTPPPSAGPGSQLGRFTQVKVLGQGTFSTLLQATDDAASPPCTAAVKLLPRGAPLKSFRAYIRKEILLHARLRHPFIARIHEVFLTPDCLAVALEYVPAGDAAGYIRRAEGGRLPESQARWLFQQLVVSLDYCHRKGIANRNLKLENLLLSGDGSDGRRPLLKVCDFGYRKTDERSAARSGAVSKAYMSPELLLGTSRIDTKKGDVWQCGVVLFALVYGRLPFQESDPLYAAKIARRGFCTISPVDGSALHTHIWADYTQPPEVDVDPGCRELIDQILVADPAKRFGMRDILLHPWFLTNLPEGSLAMNTWYLRQPDPGPSRDFVNRLDNLLEVAGSPGVPGSNPLTLPL